MDYRALAKNHAPKRKYKNHTIEADGKKFDSRREYDRYKVLSMLEKAGEICQLRTQVEFELIPGQRKPSGGSERAVKYVADFVYQDKRGHTVVEDSKGFRTKDYVLKRKLMLKVHAIEVREV